MSQQQSLSHRRLLNIDSLTLSQKCRTHLYENNLVLHLSERQTIQNKASDDEKEKQNMCL